ncbi:MAG: hypothetical protein K5765_06465 [Clostridia bacterium]|nr:hypothetical protein [Clostridia bacterium]
MKKRLILLIISIILTIISLACALIFSCNNIAFGILSGVFGSSLCFFITTAKDYFGERKKRLNNYLDFIIQFRKKIRKIKLCSEEREKALDGIISLDGNELLFYNHKYYDELASKDLKIRLIYNTINTFAGAISDFNIVYDKDKEIDKTLKELQEFDCIFFYKDGDIIKSFLDHPDFKQAVNSLNNMTDNDYTLDFDVVAHYSIDKEISLENIAPWIIPDSKIIIC